MIKAELFINTGHDSRDSSQFSRSVVSNSLRAHGLQHARPPCLSLTHGACSNSRPSSWWSHPTSLSSVIAFSSCLQSFPASGSFPVSQFFASGGQSIGALASTSVLPMNIQDWFPKEPSTLQILLSHTTSSSAWNSHFSLFLWVKSQRVLC